MMNAPSGWGSDWAPEPQQQGPMAGPQGMGAYDSGPTAMEPVRPGEPAGQPSQAIQPWYQSPMPAQAAAGMGMGPGVGAEAAPAAPTGNGTMLGVTLLLVGAGAAIGATYAGLLGAGAGILIAGAAINGVRAAKNVTQGTPEADREAAISGTFAVAGAGLAVFLLYKARKDAGEMTANKDEDDENEDDEDDAKKNAAKPAEAVTPN